MIRSLACSFRDDQLKVLPERIEHIQPQALLVIRDHSRRSTVEIKRVY